MILDRIANKEDIVYIPNRYSQGALYKKHYSREERGTYHMYDRCFETNSARGCLLPINSVTLYIRIAVMRRKCRCFPYIDQLTATNYMCRELRCFRTIIAWASFFFFF